jgi:mannose-6-phosphate isomerase-like protein (cupin superfamily)
MQYIFKEAEWMKWGKEFATSVLVGLDGKTYEQINACGLENGLPGISTHDTWVGVNAFAPGGIYESHDHETTQFYYVISGRGLVRVGDEEMVCEKGTWVFTPAGVPHYLENTGDEIFAYILFGGNPLDKDSKAHTAVKRTVLGRG